MHSEVLLTSHWGYLHSDVCSDKSTRPANDWLILKDFKLWTDDLNSSTTKAIKQIQGDPEKDSMDNTYPQDDLSHLLLVLINTKLTHHEMTITFLLNKGFVITHFVYGLWKLRVIRYRWHFPSNLQNWLFHFHWLSTTSSNKMSPYYGVFTLQNSFIFIFSVNGRDFKKMGCPASCCTDEWKPFISNGFWEPRCQFP